MRCKVRLLLLVFGMGLCWLPPAHAYNILSLDMGGYWNNLYDQYIGASEGYGTPGQQGERWYTTVSPSQLLTVNLLDYDVFLVQSAFTDDYVVYEAGEALAALGLRRADIASFLQAGGGLVAWSEPLPGGTAHPWEWAPMSLESEGVYHEDDVEIVDPDHPIMEGSTNESLSNWTRSWHGWFSSHDPRLSAVARTGDYGDQDPRTHRDLTLAGAYNAGGCGRMVFSMQDPDYHAYQQAPNSDDAATFIRASLDWTAEPCDPVPEPAGLALLGIGLVGAGIRLRTGRERRAPSATGS